MILPFVEATVQGAQGLTFGASPYQHNTQDKTAPHNTTQDQTRLASRHTNPTTRHDGGNRPFYKIADYNPEETIISFHHRQTSTVGVELDLETETDRQGPTQKQTCRADLHGDKQTSMRSHEQAKRQEMQRHERQCMKREVAKAKRDDRLEKEEKRQEIQRNALQQTDQTDSPFTVIFQSRNPYSVCIVRSPVSA